MNSKKKNSKFAVIFVIAIFAIIFIIAVVDIVGSFDKNKIAIGDVLKTGDYVECKGYYATQEILSVKNTANYVIPLGTEYYYLVFDANFRNYVLVRAGKNWKYAVKDVEELTNTSPFTISGKVRKLDWKSSNSINSRLQELELLQGNGITKYIDTTSKKNSAFVAGIMVFSVLLMILIIQIQKEVIPLDKNISSKVILVLGVVLFGLIVLFIHYLTMML